MVRDVLIGVHAAAGIAAFVTGALLVISAARGGRLARSGLIEVYAGGLAVLAATTAALVGWDWPGLGAGTRAGFVALAALAAVMVAVAVHGCVAMRRQAARWRPRFVTAAGFTLIALFAGFVIITVLDAGAPGWAVAVAAVAAILAGRWVIGRAESKAQHQDSQAARPRERSNV